MTSSSKSAPDKPSSEKEKESTSVFDYIPRLSIVRLPTGAYSPRADERCITYCSQSSRGRTNNAEPWCRTICLRYVRKHEIHGSVKLPLPPEGQPEEAVTQGVVGGLRAKDVKHWEEGYYLWWSKSRWASQEKMDIMGLTLEQQVELMRRKEFSEKQRLLEEENKIRAQRRPPVQPETPQDVKDTVRTTTTDPEYVPTFPNYTEIAANSKLIPLSPLPHDLYDSLRLASRNISTPTSNMLQAFKETLESGTQREIADTLWEKTRSGEAFGLVRKLLIQTWDRWNGNDDDDKGGE